MGDDLQGDMVKLLYTGEEFFLELIVVCNNLVHVL